MSAAPKIARMPVSHSTTGSFPDWEDIEYERSTISIPIFRDGKLAENFKAKAVLKLRRFTPATVLGMRQFEFMIDRWEVIGKSSVFGGWVGYTLADAPQPKSICLAMQSDSDYPAIIVYNALYDIYMGKDRVFSNVPGCGFGRGVMEIPPRNITVAFQKPFEYGTVSAQAGMCSDMMALTQDEFEAQAEEIRQLREGLISEPATPLV